MSALDRSREYLVWYESHRERWVAVPVTRTGAFIDMDYAEHVVIDI